MERKENSGYMKGFIPFIIAAAVLSLCGGFTAAVPANVVTDWGLDSGATRRGYGSYYGKIRGCSGKKDHHPFKHAYLRRRPASHCPVS